MWRSITEIKDSQSSWVLCSDWNGMISLLKRDAAALSQRQLRWFMEIEPPPGIVAVAGEYEIREEVRDNERTGKTD